MSSNLSYWLTHSWLSSAIFTKTKIYECSWYNLELVDFCTLQQSILQIYKSSDINVKHRIRIDWANKRKWRLVSLGTCLRKCWCSFQQNTKNRQRKGEKNKQKKRNEIWMFFSSFQPLKLNNPKIYQSKFQIRRKKNLPKKIRKMGSNHTPSLSEKTAQSGFG